MRLQLLTMALLLALVGTACADTLSVQVNRKNGSTETTEALDLTPANLGAATAAQGALADKAAGTVYYLADYASLQTAVDAATAAGGGTVLNAKGSVINITATFRPKNNVMVDLNGGTLKWTGSAGGVMVENDATTYGAKLTGLFNGKIDAGSNTTYVFKFHSLRSSYYGDLTLISANTGLEFMHLYADAQVDDPQDGVRNTYGNTFGPFRTDAGIGGVPVVGKVLTLEGFNDAGNWRGVTMNTFKGPWHLFTNGIGIDYNKYCDSNIFEGMYQITLTNPTTPGTCVIFNNSSTPSSAVDVWGEHIDHLSCETWYPALAGQKAVVINHAGGITIDYLGNDRVTQGAWPVGMVTDNYSQGHKITYVEGAPNYKVNEYIKGDLSVNKVYFPDGSTLTTAPNDTAYDATSWDGNTNAPTKNAVRDKIESILATAGTGNVTGPVSSTDNALAQYSGVTGRTIKDGPTLATSIGTPGVDTKVPTEKAVRDALATVAPSQSVGTTDTPTFAGIATGGGDWIAGTGTVSNNLTPVLTANTAGAFSALKAGSVIKLSNGTIIDVLRVIDTSNVLSAISPGTISALTWSYKAPSALLQSYGVDFGHIKSSGLELKGDGTTATAINMHNWAAASSLRGMRANGTTSAPLTLALNDVLFGVSAQGWASNGSAGWTGGAWSNAGAIQFKAAEAWTNTATGSFLNFITVTANGANTAVTAKAMIGNGVAIKGGVAVTDDPGVGNLRVDGYIVEGLDDKTASFTVSKGTSRIALATGTATVTLLKTLPAGTTSVLVTVAGAAASGVSFAAESGGSLSWGDAGTPTFANNKTADVVCTSENATATTAAAWRCVKGGNF